MKTFVQKRRRNIMRKKESKFRSFLLKQLRSVGVLARAIETGETAEAFPDIYYCYDGIVILIECKQQEELNGPSFTRKVPFRPGQYSFLIRNKEHGGNSMVAVRYKDGHLFADISAIDEDYHVKREGAWIFFTKTTFCPSTLLCWVYNTFLLKTSQKPVTIYV